MAWIGLRAGLGVGSCFEGIYLHVLLAAQMSAIRELKLLRLGRDLALGIRYKSESS